MMPTQKTQPRLIVVDDEASMRNIVRRMAQVTRRKPSDQGVKKSWFAPFDLAN